MERLKNDEEPAMACDEMRARGYTEHIAGDACVGDEVAFVESKFTPPTLRRLRGRRGDDREGQLRRGQATTARLHHRARGRPSHPAKGPQRVPKLDLGAPAMTAACAARPMSRSAPAGIELMAGLRPLKSSLNSPEHFVNLKSHFRDVRLLFPDAGWGRATFLASPRAGACLFPWPCPKKSGSP